MRSCKIVTFILCFSLNFFWTGSSQGQSESDRYQQIKDLPSNIRWCLRAAGNDPANIIKNRCTIYKECLKNADLDEKVDLQPYPNLSTEQIAKVKSCHQALYNAARTNPQIKGSSATQTWLQKSVLPGTEAKSFPVPNSFPSPK